MEHSSCCPASGPLFDVICHDVLLLCQFRVRKSTSVISVGDSILHVCFTVGVVASGIMGILVSILLPLFAFQLIVSAGLVQKTNIRVLLFYYLTELGDISAKFTDVFFYPPNGN